MFAIKRLFRQVLKQLVHPNIPAYVDSFQIDSETDRQFYLVQVKEDFHALENAR